MWYGSGASPNSSKLRPFLAGKRIVTSLASFIFGCLVWCNTPTMIFRLRLAGSVLNLGFRIRTQIPDSHDWSSFFSILRQFYWGPIHGLLRAKKHWPGGLKGGTKLGSKSTIGPCGLCCLADSDFWGSARALPEEFFVFFFLISEIWKVHEE